MAKVSVIIPTYNRLPFLERALESVVRQTFRDWELIIVDDGSTDGTGEFLNNWETRPGVKVLRSENRGVSAARNLAVSVASAPWIAFLDSDDEWLSDKLENQLKFGAHYPLIHGEEVWIRRGVRVNPMKKHMKSGGRIFYRCVELCCISPSTAMISRELFNSLGGFRADFPVCEDYELWLRIASRFEVGFVTTPLTIKYGGHTDQLSAKFKAMDFFRIKALMPFIDSSAINLTERLHVIQTVIKKSDILLAGYKKHGNLNDAGVVEAWRAQALNALTAIHKAHSAADFFPRSEDSGTL